MSRLWAGVITTVLVFCGMFLVASPASAHVLPTSTVALDVSDTDIDAALRIPIDDLERANGIDLGDDLATGVVDQQAAIADYIAEHIVITSANGTWTVSVSDFGVETAEESGTGVYDVLTADAVLTPPAPADLRVFEFGYDVVIHRVITHTVLVSVRQDWSGGSVETTREVGTISVDTATGEVAPLEVDLGDGGAWRGFIGMVTLGIHHIIAGTDHQLFLLTLLLPTPLLAIRRRWSTAVPASRAARRIGIITLSFTLGHSVTLALGTLGLPVPQQPVEALIAVSILVAAFHAIRPIFPGREALVAGLFGLVHGLAFSVTLSELDLTGGQLALSLLGFNVGIELMQLAVVALVLPPLVILARTRAYTPLRVVAAYLTGIAAVGWLLDRVGIVNPVAVVADGLVEVTPWLAGALWVAAIYALLTRRTTRPEETPHGPSVHRGSLATEATVSTTS